MSVLRSLLSSSSASPLRRPSTFSRLLLRPAAVRMISTLPCLPILEAVSRHDPESTAIVHSLSGRSFKYGELLGDVRRVRDQLSEAIGREDLNGERIAFLVENSYDYVGERAPASSIRSSKLMR